LGSSVRPHSEPLERLVRELKIVDEDTCDRSGVVGAQILGQILKVID
jgi:hypothetical protein